LKKPHPSGAAFFCLRHLSIPFRGLQVLIKEIHERIVKLFGFTDITETVAYIFE